MVTVMQIINFIRSSSALQHRLFRQLLEDTEADYKDLLLHNDVRWLSKGTALDRFLRIKEEVKEFLRKCHHKRAEKYSKILAGKTFLANVCFLNDLFAHMNRLNMQLQGRNKTVIDLFDNVNSFRAKLPLFVMDLQTNKLVHFPNLKELKESTLDSSTVTDSMTALLKTLQTNFDDRFYDFKFQLV